MQRVAERRSRELDELNRQSLQTQVLTMMPPAPVEAVY
jgi:hypothetical protein